MTRVAQPRLIKAKNKPDQQAAVLVINIQTGLNTLNVVGSEVKMVPIQITESVSVVQLPNYEERTVSSSVDVTSMRRFHDKVNLEPVLSPVHFADTMICYKDSTRKRYVSRTYYEPRVKPRQFSDTIFIYPKRPEKSFVSLLDYHIDECRKWFKTCVEFKAKTYTTTKVDILNDKRKDVLVNGLAVDYDNNNVKTGPGASHIFLPRFLPKDDDGLPILEKKIQLKQPDINMNERISTC